MGINNVQPKSQIQTETGLSLAHDPQEMHTLCTLNLMKGTH